MRVELKHHDGWKAYDIAGAESIHDAAYEAVRQSHEFLTNCNHSHDAGERESTFGGLVIRWNSVRVFREDGAPSHSGPRWYWFAVEYRDPAAMNPEGDND